MPLSRPAHHDGASDAFTELGAAMRYYRVASGVSLRAMARRLGFSGHSHLADYERGRRLPYKKIVTAYEQHLQLPAGRLDELHDRALAERAGRMAAEAQRPDRSDVRTGAVELYQNGGEAVPSDDTAVVIRLQVRLPQIADPVELEIKVACDEDTRPR
jgi:transcriptional regulator with XRE-family HTH domain